MRVVPPAESPPPPPLQDVLVVNCSKDFMASNHVLATCRTALKKQGIVGLNSAPCMRAFLERLPIMLQEQYAYEKVGGRRSRAWRSRLRRLLGRLAPASAAANTRSGVPGKFSPLVQQSSNLECSS